MVSLIELSPKPLSEWEYETKVMLYTIGQLADLKAIGFVGGPNIITERGKKIYDELRAQGFKPRPSDVDHAFKALQAILAGQDD